MDADKSRASGQPMLWPRFRSRETRRAVDRIRDRAINRAAQLLGPMLIIADGTLRSLKSYEYGEE